MSPHACACCARAHTHTHTHAVPPAVQSSFHNPIFSTASLSQDTHRFNQVPPGVRRVSSQLFQQAAGGNTVSGPRQTLPLLVGWLQPTTTADRSSPRLPLSSQSLFPGSDLLPPSLFLGLSPLLPFSTSGKEAVILCFSLSFLVSLSFLCFSPVFCLCWACPSRSIFSSGSFFCLPGKADVVPLVSGSEAFWGGGVLVEQPQLGCGWRPGWGQQEQERSERQQNGRREGWTSAGRKGSRGKEKLWEEVSPPPLLG